MRIAASLILYDLNGTPHVWLREAARRKGVSHQALLKAIRSQRLVASRVGGRMAIPLAALEAYHPDRQLAARARRAARR